MTRSGTARAPARQGTTAYGLIADRLRREIREGLYPAGVPLPTEVELADRHGVSRQTVRRAFQDLVAEDLVSRVPGRGTFAHPLSGMYMRSSGSIEDLMSLAEDTDLEVLVPPAVGIDIEAAGRLHLDTDQVVTLRFRRLHEGRPYCVTSAYLPATVGRGLLTAPELRGTGVRRNVTVLSVVRRVWGRPIVAADQTITAVPASDQVAAELECLTGQPVLRIDRLYVDPAGERLELAVNHFNPSRYTYRVQLRAGDR